MQTGLEILRWSFWSPETREPSHWSAAEPDSRPATAVPDHAIPSLHRRRMSTLAKMAVQTALEATATERPDFLVFCSQHGELNRTRDLLAAIVARGELSPTSFSQSVHNASAGLFTIITTSQAPATSLAAGPGTFAYGWIEAQAFVAANPAKRALLVSYDEPLPHEYRPYSAQQQRPHALALLLGCRAERRLQARAGGRRSRGAGAAGAVVHGVGVDGGHDVQSYGRRPGLDVEAAWGVAGASSRPRWRSRCSASAAVVDERAVLRARAVRWRRAARLASAWRAPASASATGCSCTCWRCSESSSSTSIARAWRGSAARGAVIVANHPTLLDVLVLLAHVEQAGCVVKHSLWRNPFLSARAHAPPSYIPSKDPEQLLRDCAAALETRRAADRVSRGDALGARRAAAPPPRCGTIALESDAAVKIVHFSCEPVLLPKGEPWYRIPLARPCLAARVGASVRARDFQGGSANRSVAARHLTLALQHELSKEIRLDARAGTGAQTATH